MLQSSAMAQPRHTNLYNKIHDSRRKLAIVQGERRAIFYDYEKQKLLNKEKVENISWQLKRDNVMVQQAGTIQDIVSNFK